MIAKTGLSDPYLIPDMVTLVNNFIWGRFSVKISVSKQYQTIVSIICISPQTPYTTAKTGMMPVFHFLFELYRCGRFARAVIKYSVDAFDFVHYSVCDL